MEKAIAIVIFVLILSVIFLPALDAYRSHRLTDRQRYNLLWLIFFAPILGSFVYFFYKAFFVKAYRYVR